MEFVSSPWRYFDFDYVAKIQFSGAVTTVEVFVESKGNCVSRCNRFCDRHYSIIYEICSGPSCFAEKNMASDFCNVCRILRWKVLRELWGFIE